MTDVREAIVVDSDENNELLFKVRIEGTDPTPAKVRLVCEDANGVSFMFEGKSFSDDVVQFLIPAMGKKINEGTYASKIEVVVNNRLFVPVAFDLNFKKTVNVVAEVIRPTAPASIDESVTITAMPLQNKQKKQNKTETTAKRPSRTGDQYPTEEEMRMMARSILNQRR